MGIFIVIAIIAFIIFIIVQNVDTSPIENIAYNYRGLDFGNNSNLKMEKSRTLFTFQNKFITIYSDRYMEPLKVRILKKESGQRYIIYTCMDGYRNRLIIFRSIMNSTILDCIFIRRPDRYEIYSDNPNIYNDIDKVYGVMNAF